MKKEFVAYFFGPVCIFESDYSCLYAVSMKRQTETNRDRQRDMCVSS